MQRRSTESNHVPTFTDVHDIRSLTDTGRIVLPGGGAAARQSPAPTTRATPAT